MIKKSEKGAATILIIFLLCMVGVIIGVSLVKTGYFESLMGRSVNYSAKAYYAANSGIENAIREIPYKPSEFGNPGPDTIDFEIDGVEVKTTISGDENTKTIEAVRSYTINSVKYSRKVVAKIVNTSITPDFSDAVFGGFGGVYLDNNTIISNLEAGENGNVYSRSFIKGKSNANDGTSCKNSASAVYGNATAVGAIEKWANSDKGICVTKDAYAKELNDCFIVGDATAETFSENCEVLGLMSTDTGPEDNKSIPDIGVDAIISYLSSKDKFDGDCEIGGDLSKDCTNGTGQLGSITINGNLTILQNSSLVITGSVLVNGDIDIQSNLWIQRPVG